MMNETVVRSLSASVELRLIGSKQDLKAASSLLYKMLGGQFAMKNIYKGEKGDFVAKAQLRLEKEIVSRG